MPSGNELTERVGGCLIHMELCKLKLVQIMDSVEVGVPGFPASEELKPHLEAAIMAQSHLESAQNDLRVFMEDLGNWYHTVRENERGEERHRERMARLGSIPVGGENPITPKVRCVCGALMGQPHIATCDRPGIVSGGNIRLPIPEGEKEK